MSDTALPGAVPPIVENASALLADYDVIFCDVWGVVHNGRRAYDEAGAALAAFRRRGGTVVLVSNAPVPAAGVEQVLAATGVRRDAWDAIVSSGDIALGHIAERGYRRLHHVGPRARDALLFQAVGPDTALADADAILCSGLVDDRRETAEDYRHVIDGGLARHLPFICANPDLVVDVGTERLLCAGSIAIVYEAEGGDVFWAGKPHISAYATAFEHARTLRGTAPDRRRILGIGDAVRTDLAAAEGFGCDALFIASGIHGDVLMDGARIDPTRLAALFVGGSPPARAAMTGLRL
jgi:HAD superfamily hydrolase (TIGR01459 family)